MRDSARWTTPLLREGKLKEKMLITYTRKYLKHDDLSDQVLVQIRRGAADIFYELI